MCQFCKRFSYLLLIRSNFLPQRTFIGKFLVLKLERKNILKNESDIDEKYFREKRLYFNYL